jgi:phycobilisome rod-core linker protein
MSIPLLEYRPSSQNQRVAAYEVPGDEYSRVPTAENYLNSYDSDMIINAAYRQIFHEQQMLISNRQIFLESQLRSGQITVRDFIRGLLLSDSFRRLNFESNNNYRFAEICIQRVLGRSVYNEREKIAWSIVLATKGIQGFVDELLNSDEYINSFGHNFVPTQRRRILPQRQQGDLPFERTARYGTDYRDQLPEPSMMVISGFSGLRQFEKLDLTTAISKANWGVVSMLGISGSVIVLVLLMLSGWAH